MSDPTEFESLSDPAIEARIVAMALGEASAFECAELDRLIAERPELGIFARRIKAVHDLANTALPAALNLPDEQWKLSPARRAKIEAVIGSVATPAVLTRKVAPFWRKTSRLLQIAAALILIIGVSGVIVAPSFLRSRKRGQSSTTKNDLRLIESATDQFALENSHGYSSGREALSPQPGVDLLNSPTVTTRSGQTEVVEGIRQFNYPQSAAEPAQALAMAEAVDQEQAPSAFFPMTPTTPASPQPEHKRSRTVASNEPALGVTGRNTYTGSSSSFTKQAQLAESVQTMDGEVQIEGQLLSDRQQAAASAASASVPVLQMAQQALATQEDSLGAGQAEVSRDEAKKLESSEASDASGPRRGDVPIKGRLFAERVEESAPVGKMLDEVVAQPAELASEIQTPQEISQPGHAAEWAGLELRLETWGVCLSRFRTRLR